MRFLANHQLFAEDYLQEVAGERAATDIPDAARQTMREWRDICLHLERIEELIPYLGQCLTALDFSYSIEKEPDRFILFADETRSRPLGICLAVMDEGIGRMTKGRNHQVRLIQFLRAND